MCSNICTSLHDLNYFHTLFQQPLLYINMIMFFVFKVIHGTVLTVQCKTDISEYGDYGGDAVVETTLTCLDGELASPNIQCNDSKY